MWVTDALRYISIEKRWQAEWNIDSVYHSRSDAKTLAVFKVFSTSVVSTVWVTS